MPIFDYSCKKCGKISSFLEKSKKSFWEKIIGQKCTHCGNRNLVKQYSSFSTSKNISQNDFLNDISKIAPINFVQAPSKPNCPPGGCPHQQKD